MSVSDAVGANGSVPLSHCLHPMPLWNPVTAGDCVPRGTTADVTNLNHGALVIITPVVLFHVNFTLHYTR